MAINDLRAQRVGFDQVADELDTLDGLIDTNTTDIATLESKFTAWQDWSPTLAGSGSMGVSGVTFTLARYHIVDKVCHFRIHVDFTTTGTPSSRVEITLPTTSKDAYGCHGALIVDASTTAGMVFYGSTSLLYVRKYDSSNFAISSGRTIRTSGFYELP